MTPKEQSIVDNLRINLLGSRIVDIRYITEEEKQLLGIYKCPIIIQLSNGVLIWPMRDDEGNDGGALYTSKSEIGIIPTI
ncbi:MAG: hypothetical protein M0Q12_04240 [Synergistaceae bacterium]|jgi:hypothetical protein|nr:hypothetical protein [Synergistaceae bacterium]